MKKSAPDADVRVLPGLSHMGIVVSAEPSEQIAGWLSTVLP